MVSATHHIQDAIGRARDRLSAYGKRVREEPCKPDRDAAMACIEFDEQLQLGVALYETLRHLDEYLRDQVLDGKLQDDTVPFELLDQAVAEWLAPCVAMEAQIRAFEALGFKLAGAEAFRKCHAAAAFHCADPAELFSHPKFVELRDQAVEEAWAAREG